MNQVLDTESQQLVVLNGDLITGENTYLHNSTDYVDMIIASLVDRDVLWASTHGNHDSQFNLSREAILAREQTWPNARTKQMVFGKDSGVTNYYLPVYLSDGEDEPAFILWFFDSRGGSYYQQRNEAGEQIDQPDWVDQSVIDWFLETNAELSRVHGHAIPGVGFVHISTNASRALQTEVGLDKNYQPGINDDFPIAQQGQGWCSDGSHGCEYGGQDMPFMQAINSVPGMIALFSGHDHGYVDSTPSDSVYWPYIYDRGTDTFSHRNTWCYKWDTRVPGMTVKGNGINLCFGQHTGYGGYGSWTRGSRQILITESSLSNLELQTWIRLETGEAVGSVTLNATYGEDWYPATKNTHTHCPTCEVVQPT